MVILLLGLNFFGNNSMNECLFCKIVKKEIDADIILENNDAIAFKDINPIAPNHILIIPKTHIESVYSLDSSNYAIMSSMSELANEISKNKINANDGCRWVINTGKDGGQTVYHLHLHLIAGRKFIWPPG